MNNRHEISRARAKELLAQIDAGTSPFPDHMLPVMELVLCGGADLLMVAQTRDSFRRKRKQTITLIGDDLFSSLGPSAFHQPSLRRAVKTAGGVYVVAAEPLVRIYALSAIVATAGIPQLIIETRLRHELEWVGFVKKHNPTVPMILIREKQTAH